MCDFCGVGIVLLAEERCVGGILLAEFNIVRYLKLLELSCVSLVSHEELSDLGDLSVGEVDEQVGEVLDQALRVTVGVVGRAGHAVRGLCLTLA